MNIQLMESAEPGTPASRQPTDDLRWTQRTLVLGALAAGMISDLNNLLTIIAGHAAMAAEAVPADHPAQSDLATISSVAANAGSLVNQVARYVGNVQSERRLVQFGCLMHEQRPLLERLAGPLVQVVGENAPDLWLIDGDPGELTEVVLCLIFSACAALPAGGAIRLSARNAPAGEAAVGDAVQIDIGTLAAVQYGRTSGAGAQPHAAAMIRHVHALSLESCRRVIVAHGGTLQMVEAAGQETTWRIVLPRAGAS